MSAPPWPSATIEQFRILFLDKKNQLIADEVQQQGTVDHTPVYAREVMKRALDTRRLGHRPGAQPSLGRPHAVACRYRDDAQKIVDAGQKLQIAVHDHVIVGRKGHASFRALGLI